MKDLDTLTSSKVETERLEPIESGLASIRVGQWFWVKDVDSEDEDILMCAMHIGTNYVSMREPSAGSYRAERVHRDQVVARLRHEPNADRFIQDNVARYQQLIADNMNAINRLSQDLGMAPRLTQQTDGEANSKALAVMSAQVDVKQYEQALVKAKLETLPELLKNNEKLTSELSRWLSAPSLPAQAQLKVLKSSFDGIDDKIFNIQLYAGVIENVTTISEGAPADVNAKLRVMQRRLYMDEECLLSYGEGGFEFHNMPEFDAWIAKPENRDRILPFDRCLVSMRVRRFTKARDFDVSVASAMQQLLLEISDKITFLLIRNGENLYRIETHTEFGELIFPDKSIYDPAEPMMVKMFAGSVSEFMTKREFDALIEEQETNKALSQRWIEENPREQWEKQNPGSKNWRMANPYYSNRRGIDLDEWHPFDDSSVYYDDCIAKLQKEDSQYNRIALLLQGLFDRSSVLMPHHPVQIWKPDSFLRSIELVYDSHMALTYGNEPDFEAYREACNALTTADSVMYGQELAWMVREASRYNEKLEKNWDIQYEKKRFLKTLRPYGDPGPGRVALMSRWAPRARKATFNWEREKRNGVYGDVTSASITVSINDLFNVSAYKPGDFKVFFRDPRTRAKYLKWAPMFLTAEDYHAGRIKIGEPS